jgi:hypothetical protein
MHYIYIDIDDIGMELWIKIDDVPYNFGGERSYEAILR